MKLYIFRHGMTFQTKNNIPYTPENYMTSQILPEGIPAIENIGKFLKNIKTEANYTSPFLRCIQTVEIVSEMSGKNFLPNENLREYADWLETFESLRQRAIEYIKYLNDQKLNYASICTHGGMMSALKHLLLFDKYELSQLTDYPLPGVMMIINNKSFEEIDFNS